MAMVIVQSDLRIVQTTDELSVADHIANALQSCFVYIAKIFVPTGLTVYHPYPDGFSYWGHWGFWVNERMGSRELAEASVYHF